MCVEKHALTKITQLFVLYKSILLSIVLIVPREYDTSSKLILIGCAPDASIGWKLLARIIEKLVIWDNVFFVSAAERGIIYEQEWAFGRLWSMLIGALTPRAFTEWPESPLSPLYYYGLTSIILANVSYYIATIMLYCLTKVVFRLQKMERCEKFAQTVACLFILAPSGIFEIAGYSESLFALITFTGMLLRESQQHILSGMVFALGCGIRGNGVLWGIIFVNDLYDAVKSKEVQKAISVIIGGSFMGLALLIGQAYPYFTYCPGREWCDYLIPSIYGYVQDKYWDVGFLKYWTPTNIPNFIYAAPTLTIMWYAGCKYSYRQPFIRIRPYLIVQFILFASAILVYNVQIITRISTCLPTIYWYCAELVTSTNLSEAKAGRRIVAYCIIWSVAQCIMFSAFLPPA